LEGIAVDDVTEAWQRANPLRRLFLAVVFAAAAASAQQQQQQGHVSSLASHGQRLPAIGALYPTRPDAVLY